MLTRHYKTMRVFILGGKTYLIKFGKICTYLFYNIDKIIYPFVIEKKFKVMFLVLYKLGTKI